MWNDKLWLCVYKCIGCCTYVGMIMDGWMYIKLLWVSEKALWMSNDMS